MSTDDRIGRYVEAATAGLKTDRELQLDVQAELRSHLTERLREEAATATPAAGGAAEGGDAVERALAALGPVTDVAGDLAAANRRRMKLRAQLRLALRWCLLPLAVVAALYALDPGSLTALKQVKMLSGDGSSLGGSLLDRWRHDGWFKPRYTPEQNLILHGDTSRPNTALQQRAIWEKHPASKVYFGNYLSYTMGTVSETNPDAKAMAALEADLDQGRKLEPDNARFDYILAGKLLQQAVKIEAPQTGKDKYGKAIYDLTWEIKDQATLERAMELFQAGLAKPELRRYSGEMLVERLKIMGPPDSMLSNIEQIAIAAGVLLPDLSLYRQLARASILYSEKLIESGRVAEAEPFLNAWQTLSIQLNDDSFTLIDVLVESAIVELGRKHIPDLWLKAGKPEQAEIARQNAEILCQPVRDWKAKKQSGEKSPAYRAGEEHLKKSGGILAGLLLPALGEFPKETDYTPGRLVEYVMLEKVVLALLALLLLIGMLGCGLIYLRWRLLSGGGAIPLLLLPNGRDTLKILAYGIILPVLGYYLYSRWLPLSLREYGLWILWPQVLIEASLLLLLILGLTSHLAVGAVRRRCRTLGVETPPERNFSWSFLCVDVIFLCLCLICVAVAQWDGERSGRLVLERLMLALMTALLLAELIGCGLGCWRWRLTAGDTSMPLRLLPNWRDRCRILGIGVVLPVLGYWLFRCQVTSNEYRQLVEIALLLPLILGLTAYLTGRTFAGRCRALGVKMSPVHDTFRSVLRAVLAFLVICLLGVGIALYSGEQSGDIIQIAVLVLCAGSAVGLGLFAIFELLKLLFDHARFGLYYGSVARTLIPFLALGIILLSGLAKPYLTMSERHLVRNDPLVRIDNTCGGFTNVESQLVKRLTAEIRQATAKLEKK